MNIQKRDLTLSLLVLLAFAIATPAGAQVTKQGEGDDATYLLRKHYPEKTEYQVEIELEGRTVEGAYALTAAARTEETRNKQAIKYVFTMTQGEPFEQEYVAGSHGLRVIENSAERDYAQLDEYFALLSESRLPEEAVKIGQSWALDEKSPTKADAKHTFKSVKEVDGVQVAEIDVEYKFEGADTTVTGTVWLRVEDGMLQKATYHRKWIELVPAAKEGEKDTAADREEDVTVTRK